MEAARLKRSVEWALVNRVWVDVAERLQKAGAPPDVLTSFNVDASR